MSGEVWIILSKISKIPLDLCETEAVESQLKKLSVCNSWVTSNITYKIEDAKIVKTGTAKHPILQIAFR